MIKKLPKDLADALNANDDASLEVVNPANNRTYFVVDGEIHRQAMEALRRQRGKEDHEAIAEGVMQMEAGEGIPLDEAFEDIRANLNLPQRQK